MVEKTQADIHAATIAQALQRQFIGGIITYLAVGDRCVKAKIEDSKEKQYEFWMDYDTFRRDLAPSLPTYQKLINPDPEPSCAYCKFCKISPKLIATCTKRGALKGTKVMYPGGPNFYCANYALKSDE